MEGYEDGYYFGRRPTGPIMPPFRNVFQQDDVDFQGKYLVSTGASRQGWGHALNDATIGSELKKKVAQPGPWNVYMSIQGETIPKYDNHIRLSEDKTDPWGIPQVITSVDYDDNDDIIYIASHGSSGFRELFMGSTTDRVLKRANCTVAVVKGEE